MYDADIILSDAMTLIEEQLVKSTIYNAPQRAHSQLCAPSF
jgi:hypothetical protein